MIRECTKKDYSEDCGNCSHSSTNGFFAPSMWCNQYPDRGQQEEVKPYCYIDEKHRGTTCEKFERISR